MQNDIKTPPRRPKVTQPNPRAAPQIKPTAAALVFVGSQSFRKVHSRRPLKISKMNPANSHCHQNAPQRRLQAIQASPRAPQRNKTTAVALILVKSHGLKHTPYLREDPKMLAKGTQKGLKIIQNLPNDERKWSN